MSSFSFKSISFVCVKNIDIFANFDYALGSQATVISFDFGFNRGGFNA
jgi:hypothetical protein